LGKSYPQRPGFSSSRFDQADVAKAMQCLILFSDGLLLDPMQK
jgi:hypothetical protein